MKKFLSFLCIGILSVLSLSASGKKEPCAEPVRLRLATTTSTDNSGLLGELLPAFTEKTGIPVDVIAVGTGKAIALGEQGDVDVILVHARGREDAFVADGFGVDRRDVMHNDFIILGPSDDPSVVKSAKNLEQAMGLLAQGKSPFVSRGDDSGTNIKELSLWSSFGLTPKGEWYKEAGQGMGSVITMTNEMGGYTLSDRGTYLSMMDKINLQIVFEGDSALFNPYGIIAVNPDKHANINFKGAEALIDYITGEDGQALIKNFRKNGEILFFPDVIK